MLQRLCALHQTTLLVCWMCLLHMGTAHRAAAVVGRGGGDSGLGERAGCARCCCCCCRWLCLWTPHLRSWVRVGCDVCKAVKIIDAHLCASVQVLDDKHLHRVWGVWVSSRTGCWLMLAGGPAWPAYRVFCFLLGPRLCAAPRAARGCRQATLRGAVHGCHPLTGEAVHRVCNCVSCADWTASVAGPL